MKKSLYDAAYQLDQLAVLLSDPSLAQRAQKVRERIRGQICMLPMDKILAKVPGDTIAARARACGISRETYYAWEQGRNRPRLRLAKRLAAITGYSLTQIRGQS